MSTISISGKVTRSCAECGALEQTTRCKACGATEVCRTCGDLYREGGDGFDGECPSCADECACPRPPLAYWAGLQDDEVSAHLGCGCLLHSEGSRIEPDACDVAFFACPTHDHAEDLRREVEDLLVWFEQTKDENDLARIHSVGLDSLRRIIHRMRGE